MEGKMKKKQMMMKKKEMDNMHNGMMAYDHKTGSMKKKGK